MKSGEFQFPPSVVGASPQCLNVLMDDIEGQTPEINQTLVSRLSPLLFKLLEQIFQRCCVHLAAPSQAKSKSEETQCIVNE